MVNSAKWWPTPTVSQTQGNVGLLWRAMRPRPLPLVPARVRFRPFSISAPGPELLAPQEGAQMRGAGMYS